MKDQREPTESTIAQAGLPESLEGILSSYLDATANERFGKASSMWPEFTRATDALRSSKLAAEFPRIVFKWSMGQGNWANVPWIAALDSKETRKTSEGVYVIYLFRADMTGLYLTLNQATSAVMSGYSESGSLELRKRAARLRELSADLTELGFTVDEGIDLRSNVASVRAYQDATVAFKLYERDAVPDEKTLLSDLENALRVYETLVPSRRLFH